MKSIPKLPFAIDRASRTDLSRQVTDGLRAAIRSGFFKPGDILPPVQAMRKALGVSVRAPLEAVRCLQDEGLVASRRHVGVIVLGSHEMSWKGHVLVIYPNVTPVFSKSVLEMRLSDRLLAACQTFAGLRRERPLHHRIGKRIVAIVGEEHIELERLTRNEM